MANAEQIARIEQLERIKALEEEQGLSEENEFVPEKHLSDYLMDAAGPAGKTLGAAAKILDVPRGLVGGPLYGMALEKLTGKQVLREGDVLNAINPTNLEMFPGTAEMAERAGIPEGGKVSDFLPGAYAEPGPQNPWYTPERGGNLDFTLRGSGGLVGDVLTDPLTYLSFGANRLAKEGAETASKKALDMAAKKSASLPGKVLNMGMDAGSMAIDKLAMPATATAKGISKLPGGKAALGVTTPISDLLKWTGKKTYNSVLLPVEHEGQLLGKADLGDTFYKAGIKTPLGLRGKSSKAVTPLLEARNKILDEAGEAGARVPMRDAVKSTRAEIARIRATGDPQTQWIADQMEEEIGKYVDLDLPKIETGTPGVPDAVQEVNTGLLDELEQPITRTEIIPGKPGTPGKIIPAKQVTPAQASGYKSSLYRDIPEGKFKEAASTSKGQAMRKQLAYSLGEATDETIEKTMGKQSAKDVKELNKDMSSILGTQRSQQTISNQADRLQHSLVQPNTGTMGAISAIGGAKGAATKYLLDAARSLTMPTGYLTRKAGESIGGPTIDVFLRRKLIQELGAKNGQEEE